MVYFGKLLGGLAGAATGRWWLALLGVLLGHQFDRGYANRRRGELSVDTRARDMLFTSLGALAKADGVVRPAEISAARKLMHRLQLSADEVEASIAAFRRGKSPALDLGELVRNFCKEARPSTETRSSLLRLILTAVIEGGSMNKSVRARLWVIAQALDVGRVELVQIEALLRAEAGVGEARRARGVEAELRDAYQTLELDPAASDKDVKKAYRRLMNRHHPDKLEGRGADTASVEQAEQISRDIIRAYERIRRQRRLR